MEPSHQILQQNQTPPTGSCSKGHKRIKLSDDGDECIGTMCSNDITSEEKRARTSSKVVDYSDRFAIVNLFDRLGTGKYGSATKLIEELAIRRSQVLGPYLRRCPSLQDIFFTGESSPSKDASGAEQSVIDLEDDSAPNEAPPAILPVINLDSDEEDNEVIRPTFPSEEDNRSDKPTYPFQEIVLGKSVGEPFTEVRDHQDSGSQGSTTLHLESDMNRDKGVYVGVEEDNEVIRPTFPSEEDNRSDKPTYHFEEIVLGKSVGEPFIEVRDHQESGIQGSTTLLLESDMNRDKGGYVGVEEEEVEKDVESEAEDDGLGDIWNEMSLAMEVSKDTFECPSFDEHNPESEEYCDHSFVLKDDLGYVCRVCGIIQRGIETIIDIQFNKVKSSRTYMPTSGNSKDRDPGDRVGLELPKEDLVVTDISAHPRHLKQMKPHQVEGFKFLCGNLVADSPGGCILAHAPGSGKTFMIISFVQSFLAKYPDARPLVVLPKGILQTWKKEFLTWQVEDIPLLDFYTVKADSRTQQLEVLKQWVDQKSILFLGYKQFSTIVCDDGRSNAAINCREILLKIPSMLILDEGHTPRNEDTEVLQSLAMVETPRKVVLSGTLYQNHVKEVFNILNLVRPKFLKLDTSRLIMKRIMSKVHIPSERKQFRGDLEATFFEMVEHTIQRDADFKRKVTIIQDLREMTSKVLHYYKGDFLDDLPGLVDFTVVLSLTSKQKEEVSELKKLSWKFKRSSVGSAVYLHPKLKSFSENSALTDDKMDDLLENIDFKDGVKAKFFLNILSLCESARAKLLVFSQYLPPLKFLERLVMKVKGWYLGREVFVISGESSSDQRERAMESFNNSSDAKVFFGSIKACGEGISLVGASRVIILDVHLNPSVTRQAIGRAFRPGQRKKVYVYRLVAADSPEGEDHSSCFKKEAIAKMWFEWNEYCGYKDFEMENVQPSECGDPFLESSLVGADIRALYRR